MERVSVEIWRKILDLAMKTWLLPGSGNNLIDDILLFNSDCESTMEYRRFEAIRRRLRLVCRSWKQVADEHDIGFTISIFRGNAIPSEAAIRWAKRIQVPSDWRCSCTQCPNISGAASPDMAALVYYMSISPIRGTVGIDSSSTPDSAQVLVLSPLQRNILPYLQRATSLPNLRAISCDAHGYWGGADTQVQTLFENLTHLYLKENCSAETGIILSLQRLEYLRVGLSFASLSTGIFSSIGDWAFPQLTTFFVSGQAFVNDNKKLQRFFHSHALTLRNIIIDYEVMEEGDQKSQAPDPPPFQEYPVLEAIGTNLLAPHCILDNVTENNQNGSGRFSLLLTNIPDVTRPQSPDPTFLAQRFIRMFDSISIPCSWGQLSMKFDAEIDHAEEAEASWQIVEDALSCASTLFAAINKSGVSCRDKDGVDLREGAGLQLLQWFEQISTMETSKDAE
ncbi:hypothetical protein FRC17_011055 [Serendipita sp. 399]|nr:hypothetical protein FRC17_011055 [Serendipita sp. 399]